MLVTSAKNSSAFAKPESKQSWYIYITILLVIYYSIYILNLPVQLNITNNTVSKLNLNYNYRAYTLSLILSRKKSQI